MAAHRSRQQKKMRFQDNLFTQGCSIGKSFITAIGIKSSHTGWTVLIRSNLNVQELHAAALLRGLIGMSCKHFIHLILECDLKGSSTSK